MSSNFKLNIRKPNFRLQKESKQRLTPQNLSLILVILALILSSIITYPLMKVFSGEEGWVLNQGIVFFTLDPIQIPFLGFIDIGEVGIRFYALMVLIGILSGYFLAIYLANRAKLSTGFIDTIFLGLLIFGLGGARIIYVLFNLEYFSANWIEIINLRTGGMSFFGGALFGGLYLLWYARKHKFNLFELLDILAPSVLLGQVIGRWGNFFNYESYGPSTSLFWGMFVPEPARLANKYQHNLNAEFFHPTFLYESLLNFGLLIYLLWNYDKLTKNKSGFVFAYYAIGYGTIRFFLEFLRLDALILPLPQFLHFSPVSGIVFDKILVSQLFAIGFVIIGFWVIVKRKKVLFLNKSMKEIKI